jgi:hypothetical protein
MSLDGSGQGTAAPNDHITTIPLLDLGKTTQLAQERDPTVNARAQISGRLGLSGSKPVTHVAENVVERIRRQALREDVEHQAQQRSVGLGEKSFRIRCQRVGVGGFPGPSPHPALGDETIALESSEMRANRIVGEPKLPR